MFQTGCRVPGCSVDSSVAAGGVDGSGIAVGGLFLWDSLKVAADLTLVSFTLLFQQLFIRFTERSLLLSVSSDPPHSLLSSDF